MTKSCKVYHRDLFLSQLLFLIYINSFCFVPLTSSLRLVLYADDILLPISCQADYAQLQLDTDALHCVSRHHLTLKSSKCKFLCVSRRRAPCFTAEPEFCLE